MPNDKAKQILDDTFKYLHHVLEENKRDMKEVQEIMKRSYQKRSKQKDNDLDSADTLNSGERRTII
jgi:hypothetical protein